MFYFVLIRLVFSVEISKLKSPDIAGVSSEYMIAYLREFYEKYEEKKNSSVDAGRTISFLVPNFTIGAVCPRSINITIIFPK